MGKIGRQSAMPNRTEEYIYISKQSREVKRTGIFCSKPYKSILQNI